MTRCLDGAGSCLHQMCEDAERGDDDARYWRSTDGRIEAHAMRLVGVRRRCTLTDLRRCTCGDLAAHLREIEDERVHLMNARAERAGR